MLLRRFTAIFFAATMAACTVYQSDGRKIVEENEGGVLGTTGFAAVASAYYVCTLKKAEPDFLKEPYEVVATPYDSEKFTTLYNAATDASTVIVYTVTDENLYAFCHVTGVAPLGTARPVLTPRKIQLSATVGVEELHQLIAKYHPDLATRP